MNKKLPTPPQSEIIDEIIFGILKEKEITEKNTFQKFQNSIYAKYGLKKPIPAIAFIERYYELIDDAKIEFQDRVHKLFRKRAIRNLSGIAVISLLTKFWGCPGKCIFCPTFKDLPKSYIPDEPAVQRAVMNEFDPVRQIQNRLRGLEITGNTIEKCDVRIIGGTWTVYPKAYQELFMKGIYDAHNTYSDLRPYIQSASKDMKGQFAEFRVRAGYKMNASQNLEEAKKRNENANSRVIGIAIETRPDWIDIDEIKRLRKYGVTRVEIGYQTTFDEINKKNKRGHGNKESIEATKLLKDAGFKVVAHMMPNLLGSTPKLDREALSTVFNNSDFRPDELKIYPMVVTENSELTEIWKKWWFTAYDDETLIDLMADLQAMIPEWVRLNRMYRDIPAHQILHGSTIANLRQLTLEKMKEKWLIPKDISACEIRDKGNDPHEAKMSIVEYEASDGKEYFLSFRDPKDQTLFSILRLRIPSWVFTKEKHFMEELEGCSIIREVHTFGNQLKIGQAPDGSGQHMGFGRKLLEKAEEITQEKYGLKKIAVIAGVGVRSYFEKNGYIDGTDYRIKRLK